VRPDRQMAIEAMQNMGWTAKRATAKGGAGPMWEFRRPDTGGLWDLVKCRQANLSLTFVANTAMAYGDAPDLVVQIEQAKEDWLRQRFYAIFTAAREGKSE